MGQEEREDNLTRPAMPTPGADEEELSRKCSTPEEREKMPPKETANCAGLRTEELFMENEEPGGT